MHTLISPKEVVEIAFSGSELMDEDCISDALILSAEQKYIRPVFGKLYDAMYNNLYTEFLDQYIKAPLALYVKLLSLSSLSIHAGNLGLVQHQSNNMKPCSDAQQRALASQVRTNAMTLIRRAIEQIELNPSLYPEYNSAKNILNSTTLSGQIVL